MKTRTTSRTRDQKRRSFLGAINERSARFGRLLRVEPLEDRRMLAYTASLVGGAASLVGDAAADTLRVDVDGGGLLRHNRATAGDAGFDSDTDWISGDGAVTTTIAAAAVTSLTVSDAGNNDVVIFAQAPAGTSSALDLTNAAATLNAAGYTSITDDGNFSVTGIASFTAAAPGIVLLGDGAAETTNFGSLTFSTPNNLEISEDSSTALALTSTANSALIRSAGAITDAEADGGAEFLGTSLGLSAVTGIDIDTTVSNLEAETITGGILVNNGGALSIGGVTATIAGLDVATSGDIVLANAGTIILNDTDGLQTVKGGNASGSVTLTANGAASNITSGVDLDAVVAPAGNITLSAGQDVLMGTGGANFDNDVRASGSITVNAGRDLVIDGFADVASDDFGTNTGGSVTVTVGRNIAVDNNTGNDGSIGASGTAGGSTTLTTGAGGSLLLAAGVPFPVFSNSGNVVVNADRIDAASGILAPGGRVILRPRSAAWAIDLGSATDVAVATLELADAELDRIFSPVLEIGDSANTGNITLTSQITATSYSTLSLRTGGAVVDGTGTEQPDITAASLALRAAAGIGSADEIDVAVTNLAFSNGTGAVNISDSGALTIGAVDGLASSANAAGATAISAASALTIAANVTSSGTATFTAGEVADFPVCADDLTVNDGVVITVTGGNLVLRAGDDIVLGSATLTASGSVILNPAFGDLDACGEIIVTGTPIINSPGFVLFGSPGDDTLIVTATSADSGSFTLNGGAPVAFAGVTSFSFFALAGNDTFIINNPAGGLFAPTGGIFYDGGGQPGDALSNRGGAAISGSYTPGPGTGDGVIIHVGAAVTQTITFSGLAPADDIVAEPTFTINGTAAVNAISVTNGPVVAAVQTDTVAIDAFEPINFGNKTNVLVNALGGTDTVVVNFTIAATGLAALSIDAGVDADEVDVLANPAITLNVDTASGVPDRTVIGGSFAAFNTGAGITANVLGTVNVTDSGGLGELYIDRSGDPAAAIVTVTSTTITGAAPATITYSLSTGPVPGILQLALGAGADTVNVQSSDVNTTTTVFGNGGSDVMNVSSDAPANTGTLDNIAGILRFNPGGNAGDTLNISDSGDADADAPTLANIGGNVTQLSGIAPGVIQYQHAGVGGGLAILNVSMSQGVNTVTISDTTATATTTIQSNGGDDVWTVAGDNLSASNIFQGNLGNDSFTLNIAGNIGANAIAGAAITGVQIQGNDPAGSSANRDRVTINDNSAAARDLDFQYLSKTSGDLDIEAASAGNGLFGGAALGLQLRTTETVIFNGAGNNDSVSASGTAENDLLTVGLLNNNTSALVFLDGTPYLDTPPETIANSRPGIAGGGLGPDLLINGLAPGAGILLSGGGIPASGGDRAIVYAASESSLVDVGNPTDIFGFGAGVLIPGFGVGNAYDTITADDTGVFTTNNAFGSLTPVLLNTASFVQGTPASPFQQPGLIINGGDEAVAQASGIADDITVTVSSNFNIQVNGNLPSLAFGPDGLPIGDQLQILGPGDINIFSDKATPPNVIVTFSGNPAPFGVGFSSIERLFLDAGSPPASGAVNLIGDNNDPAVDQTDNFVVRGRDVDGNLLDAGYQEMTVSINGSPPILLNGVQRLNVFGFDQNPADGLDDDPATPDTADDIDTLDIRAYADNAANPPNNAPRGWGVDVFFNEGVPAQADGAQQDLVIFHTSAGLGGGGSVSENIVIVPSGPDNGEIRDTNAADGSVIVVLQYVANTDIIVVDDDLSISDTDTLTLLGTVPLTGQTSGNDRVTIDLTEAGDAANPKVVVEDPTNITPILYRLRDFVGFPTLYVDTLAGDDEVRVNNNSATQKIAITLGDGNDTLDADFIAAGPGLSLNLPIRGGAGNDILRGSRGIDLMHGDAGNDTLDGNAGADQKFGDEGSDTFIWDPGDGSDLIEGGANESDILVFNGSTGNELFTLNSVGTRLELLRSLGAIDMDVAGVEEVRLNRDATFTSTLTQAQEVPAPVPVVPAPTGTATLRFNSANNTFDLDLRVEGLSGPITVSHLHVAPPGVAGPIIVDLGSQASYVADAGGLRRIVRGLSFPAANIADLLAGNVYVNVHTALNPAGEIRGQISPVGAAVSGSDTFVINDLWPTDVRVVNLNLGIDLAAPQVDQVTVAGRNVSDNVNVAAAGGIVSVTGLRYDVNIAGALAAQTDGLTLLGRGGNDTLKANDGVEAQILISIDGGAGDDFVSGDATLIGGDGNDTIVGGSGNDIIIGDGSSGIAIGLTATGQLARFDIASPGALAAITPVTGLIAGDVLVGVDVRPANGLLYGVAVNAGVSRVYVIDPLTGAATLASTLSTPLVGGTAFGVDFNPVVDRLRIVSDNDLNFNVDVDTGTTIVQTVLNPGNPNVVGAAYSNNFGGATTTTLFTIDSTSDTLSTQTPPAAGTQVLVGALGVDTSDVVALDIAAGSSAGLATLTVGGVTGLYSINLATGAATLIGNLPAGTALVGVTLLSGEGDDQLFGGAGDDLLSGGPGEDVFVGGAGSDTLHGGAGFDTILVQGTSANERIDILQNAVLAVPGNTTVSYEVSNSLLGHDGIIGGAGTETDILAIIAPAVGAASPTVEGLRLLAGSGDDVIRAAHDDSFIDNAQQALSLRLSIDGGQPGASDRLTVTDLGLGDTTIHRIGGIAGSGSFQVGALAPVVYSEVEFASLNPVNPVTGGSGADGLGTLFVFKHDSLESNDSRVNATFLGSNSAINVDPTIDPGVDPLFGLPGDEDWYRIVAQFTGDLDIRVFHRLQGDLDNGRAGLPGDGNLDIALYDADGLSVVLPPTPFIIAGDGTFGANDDDDERIRIPAVEGQTYYLRVRGAPVAPDTLGDLNTSEAVNVYNVSVINTPAPTPFDLELDDVIATSAVAAAPIPSATSFAGGIALPGVLDFFTGKDLVFTSGPLIGQRGRITSYSAARVFGFAANTFTGAPTAGNTFQIESVDTGRSQLDNITRDNTPTIFLRVADSRLLLDIPENGTGLEPGLPPDVTPIVIPFEPSTDVNAPAAGFRVAIIHVENDTHTILGYAQPRTPPAVPGGPGVYEFTFTTALADGSHFIAARVEMIDPANPEQAQGLGALSQSLEIVVDTVVPPVFFGLPNVVGDGLAPGSDSGIGFNQPTLVDRITNITTPTFFGQAEANAVIRLFLDANNNTTFEPAIDFQIGFDVAEPLDGTNQYPTGYWEVTSNVNLNALPVPLDGIRRIFVSAEDVAGNINNAPPNLINFEIFLDTQGPQVTDVDINNAGNPYDLFDPKPSTDGPTPLVNSLVISFQDLPARVLPFLFPALKEEIALTPGIYQVRGDYNGIIPILDVNLLTNTSGPGIATATVELVFRTPGVDGVFNTSDDIGQPLFDDRYTLSISDSLSDIAGNALDGESNASQPLEDPTFPSGDGVPGGDFVARFTVDSRPELGVWAAGSAFLDINGNSTWDPDNGDFTNRDIAHVMGYVSDDLFAGKFMDVNNPADRNVLFDKLGAYGRVGTSTFRWLIDTDNDGVSDIEVAEPAGQGINGLPVAGNFALGFAGDEVGVFTGTSWHFDTDHDFSVVDAGGSATIAWPAAGQGIVGDFDGDGLDDLASWSNDVFTIDLSSFDAAPGSPLPGNPGIDGTLDKTFKFGFIGPGERPVAADMNQDGIEDIGLWMPARDGITPRGQSEWYFLVSGVTGNDTPGGPVANIGPTIAGSADPTPGSYLAIGDALNTYGVASYFNGRIVTDPLVPGQKIVRFQPVPFGNDQYFQFGDDFALPLVGNFDPPVTTSATIQNPSVNTRDRFDVNNDGTVNQIDLLGLINHLTVHGNGPAPSGGFLTAPFIDVNDDHQVNAIDVLAVVNYLTLNPIVPQVGAQGEGEGNDEFFSQLGSGSGEDDSDDLLDLLAKG